MLMDGVFDGDLPELDAKLLLEQATVNKVPTKAPAMIFRFTNLCSFASAAISIPS